MTTIFLAALVTFFASIVGTLSGFGTGTILTPVMLFFLPYAQTIFVVGVIHTFQGLWKIVLFRAGINWRLFFYIGIPGMITSIFGALFVVKEKPTVLLPILGFFLIAYACYMLIQPSFYLKATVPTAVIGGSIAGLCAGLFGIRGAINSAVLAAFHLPPTTYLSTIGMISIVTDSSRLITYLSSGVVLTTFIGWMLAACIPATLLGSLCARYLISRISYEKFRVVVAFFLLLAGIKLVFFPNV
jgi:uncharacterized membrane protein YfcA